MYIGGWMEFKRYFEVLELCFDSKDIYFSCVFGIQDGLLWGYLTSWGWGFEGKGAYISQPPLLA